MKKVLFLLTLFASAFADTYCPAIKLDKSNEEAIERLKIKFGSEWSVVYYKGVEWLEIYKKKLNGKGKSLPSHVRYLSQCLDNGLETIDLKTNICRGVDPVFDYPGLDRQFRNLFEAAISNIEECLEVLPSKLRKMRFSWITGNKDAINSLKPKRHKDFTAELKTLSNSILEDKMKTGGLWSEHFDSKTGKIVQDELAEFFYSEADKILASYNSNLIEKGPECQTQSMFFRMDDI
jgi:hypothetical protein